MFELFRVEAENQGQALTGELLVLEREPTDAKSLEAGMRAAHSIKGAARIVGVEAAVRVAHAIEDCLVAAQKRKLTLGKAEVDQLLLGVDMLLRIAKASGPEQAGGEDDSSREIQAITDSLSAMVRQGSQISPPREAGSEGLPSVPSATGAAEEAGNRGSGWEGGVEIPASQTPDNGPTVFPLKQDGRVEVGQEPGRAGDRKQRAEERVLRVTADRLHRLLELAGESLVESRWLGPYAQALQELHQQMGQACLELDTLRDKLAGYILDESTRVTLLEVQNQALQNHRKFGERLVELQQFDRRSATVSRGLYEEALACRMRPFSDGTAGFPRLVRDTARVLGKTARLEIVGEDVSVDRDILERLEAPLTHLLRNAVDHGIESPWERTASGKPAEGVVRLEARHGAGLLWIMVSDDGRGVDMDRLRQQIVDKRLATAESAGRFSENELLDFLFKPGFSTKAGEVTDISGRGVGLDVVGNMARSVRGAVRVATQPGRGLQMQLKLPLNLSVMRVLLTEISGEVCALPMGSVIKTLTLPNSDLTVLDGRRKFSYEGQEITVLQAREILGRGESAEAVDSWSVVVLGEGRQYYGLAVDRFLGESQLVAPPLERRLGQIKGITAGAVGKDGASILILDPEDLIRSMEKRDSTTRFLRGRTDARRRILVVEDSLTVREIERKLLEKHGYKVETSVDGLEGWNMARTGNFNLLLCDVDMPRMGGYELARTMRQDPRTRAMPIIMVSFRDQMEDRWAGLAAGADYYLTKGSIHDGTLLQTVEELIGSPNL